MTNNAYIGWDVGGAHLKMAHVNDNGMVVTVRQIASPLWEGIEKLEYAISEAKKSWPHEILQHSVTTTAELADIFQDRHAGVITLREQLNVAFGNNKFQFYAGNEGLVPASETARYTAKIASANWHATANYVAWQLQQGILLDVGSTTTDLIPFYNGQLNHIGYSDHERLRTGELVYTGIVRTPVMAVVDQIPSQGEWHLIAAEHFATMADVYRLIGELQAEDDVMDTADGAGKQQLDSARRLARMLGADFKNKDELVRWQLMASYIAEQQLQQIQNALYRILSRIEHSRDLTLVGAGAGRFIVEKLANRNKLRYLDFADLLDVDLKIKPEAARCATAVSVAQINRMQQNTSHKSQATSHE